MKLRSSHFVVGILVVSCVIVTLAVLRSSRQGPDLANLDGTDKFLSQVKEIREQGGGSGAKDGQLPSADIKVVKTAQLEFAEKTVEMGIIPHDRKTEKRLSVKNVGEIPVDVLDIRTSCACTLGKFERSSVRSDGREITTIRPGEEIGLMITVDPTIIHGFFAHKQITITTNDPGTQQFVIDVISHVDPELSMEPETINFGEVQRGTSAEVHVVVRQLIDEPIAIGSVKLPNVAKGDPKKKESAAPAVDIELIKRPETEWKTPGHAEWDVIARLSPDAPPGELNAVFWLVTDLKRVTEIEGKIYANVISFFSVAPDSLGARNVAVPGQSRIAQATISSSEPIAVSDATVSGSDLGVELVPQDTGKDVDIYLNVLPGATPGLKNEVVELTVKSGDKAVKHTMRAYVSVQSTAPAAG